MKLLYFASVRQTIGLAGEEITLPANVVDAGGLVDWLKRRGGVYAEALAQPGHDDEVALFPPVTGG